MKIAPMQIAPWLNRNLIGFGIASFFSDCNHEIIPLILPLFITQLMGSQYAPYYLGIISGVSTGAASITVLFSGWLSDRIPNRKPILLIGYGLIGPLGTLIATAHSWLTVLFFNTGAWIGRGMTSAPRNALIADSTDPAYYGHAFGFRQALDTAGAVAGPLLVYLLSDKPLSTIFLIALIPGLAAFLTIALFIREVPRKTAPFKEPLPLRALPRSFYWFLGTFLVFGIGNFSKVLLLLRIQQLLGTIHALPTVISITTLLYIFRNIMQAAASYVIGAVSDAIGRYVPLGLFGFTFFGCMCLALMWPSTSSLFLISIFFLSGVSAGSYTTLAKSIAADLLPEEIRGTGYGMLLTVISIGNLLSSIIVGFLWTSFSPEVAFSFAALLSFLAVVMLIGVNGKQQTSS